VLLEDFALLVAVLLSGVCLHELQRQIAEAIGDAEDDAKIQQTYVDGKFICFSLATIRERIGSAHLVKFKSIRDCS